MRIVLASTSKYRKSLLSKLQLDFICHKPNVEEHSEPNESAQDMALRLAKAKAQDVAKHYPDALIIGSDQTASVDNAILGKPGNAINAKRQLQQCSGKDVIFHTGLCVINVATGQQESITEPYTVSFRQLTDLQIDNYIAREAPFDCAGSFKCEGLGITLFRQLHGRDPNTLIGLPLIALCDILDNFNISVLSAPNN
ncbi:Maf family protein [Aliiglaciecola lipolytica]|uniref:7-methyl-GTP pyrophosphatase n=1 Tax=Aliiglaciecola lipolytica E3 TaxID=1127673 RepID=K6X2K4_9ALTE|nr:Maf-like protein yceF [Aliiglaciecola lipolytica E3]